MSDAGHNMSRPRWFSVIYQRTLSRYAHLFDTEPTGVAAGQARALCGVSPYERYERPQDVLFAVAKPEWDRCPVCLNKGESHEATEEDDGVQAPR